MHVVSKNKIRNILETKNGSVGDYSISQYFKIVNVVGIKT